LGTISNIRWFYIIGVAYMLLMAYGILQEQYWVHAIPVMLIGVYLMLFKLDSVLLILNFLIPFSIQIDDIGMGMGISLPDEPIVMVIMAASIYRFIIDGNYDKKVLKHPITILIIVNVLWHFITTITSDLPWVSFKYSLSRLWYVVVFYFLSVMLFRNITNMYKYLWVYIISLSIVVLYTLFMHGQQGFTQESSYYISMPFYIAHGIYSAAISFFVPLFVGYLFYARKLNLKWYLLLFVMMLLALFLLGVAFSYTRAAWLSVLVSLGMFLPLIFRLRFNTQLIILGTGLMLFFTFQDQIFYALSKNKQDSGEGFGKHMQSASNIRTDASNIERINRWMSAINMFKERPLVGYGPGTYTFVYAPHQEARYRTLISTNFGNQGNSHSEFLNPLSETGALGLITLVAILYMAFNTGFKLLYSVQSARIKLLLVGVTFGLIGYFTHGFLNVYSETNKIAPLFWGGLAIIVAIDVFHSKEEKEEG
jgi:putative inorganic carbon (HCO3(-)) transporter